MPKRNNPKTSLCAYRDAQDMIQTHHALILEALQALEFANYEAIAHSTSLDKHAVGRRLSELELAGKIFKSGMTKPTSSGRPAFCYCLTNIGADQSEVIKKVRKAQSVRPKPPIQQTLLQNLL